MVSTVCILARFHGMFCECSAGPCSRRYIHLKGFVYLDMSDRTWSSGGPADSNAGLATCAGRILLFDYLLELLYGLVAYQIDRAAAEAATHHARAQHARHTARQLNQRIQFRTAYLVFVA